VNESGKLLPYAQRYGVKAQPAQLKRQTSQDLPALKTKFSGDNPKGVSRKLQSASSMGFERFSLRSHNYIVPIEELRESVSVNEAAHADQNAFSPDK